MPSNFASLLLAAASLVANTASAKVSIEPESRTILDNEGRALLLHGVNVVYKVDPFIPSDGEFDPEDSLNDEDIQNLADWGFNFVRLGVMWEAVERERDIYDDDYLGQVENLINKLGEKGIYTLVDMHQDVFARVMCGEGFPNFYAKEVLSRTPHCISPFIDPLLKSVWEKLNLCINMDWYDYAKDENGNPEIADCQTRNFASYYTTAQSQEAFDALWTNKHGLQDRFVAYWNHTSRFLANNPYVLGWDPINEPFPGKVVRKPFINLPGRFDKNELTPVYERLFEVY